MKNFIMGVDALADNMLVPAGTVAGNPVQIVNLNGVAVSDRDAVTLDTVVDFSPTKAYKMSVRNVATYAAGEEETFKAGAIGTIVYFDDTTAKQPTGVKLSLSPEKSTEAATMRWGIVVGDADATVTAKTMTLLVMPVNPAV